MFASTIPSGTTVTGAWGGRFIAPNKPTTNSYLLTTSFPVPAPVALDDAHVNTAPYTPNPVVSLDGDPSCTGTADDPTAPAGKVGIYISDTSNATVEGFSLADPGGGTSEAADRYGFIVRVLDGGGTGDTASTSAYGTWAYTAP